MDALKDVDGVVVAGHAASHATDALDAVKAGKPVLVIKPLATKIADAEALYAAAAEKGVLAAVGYDRCFAPAMDALRQRVHNGDLGRVFHAPPNVLHYGRPGTGAILEPGMFFTIEPMVNLGRPETKVLADDWTAVTRDKSLSAQFEHSVGVTADGYQVFTHSPGGLFHPTYAQ